MSSNFTNSFQTSIAYGLGLLHYQFKNWNKADECFGRAVEIAPNHAESLFKRGMIRYKHKNWINAFPYIQKALFIQPDRIDWMAQLKSLESRLDASSPPRSYLSVDEIQERIESSGESAFLYSQLARTLRRQSNWWQEVEALRAAVILDGNDGMLRFRFAYALAGMKRFSEAAEHYKCAVDLVPDNGKWYYYLGCALATPDVSGACDPESADRYFKLAVAAQKSSRLQSLGVGALHQDAGNWALAADAFAERSRAEPTNAALHFHHGDARQHLYQWAEAAEAYQQAVTLDPEHPKWHYRLGFVSERLGDFVTATQAYATAIRKNPTPSPLWSYRLGYVLEKTGRFAEACDAYRNAHEDVSAIETATDHQGNRTVDAIRSALDVSATDPADWRLLGVLLEEQQDWTGAVEAYDQAVARQEHHDPDLYHRLGRCLVETGRPEAAAASFRSVKILQRPHGVSQSEFRSKAGIRKSASFTEYLEVLEIDTRKILYESFHGNQMTCNPYAIFLHLLDRTEFANHTHVWVINDRESIPEKFRNLRNVIFIPKEGDGYMRHLATASVLINNSTFPHYFIRKKGQTYLNTWHGTPWKTLGKDDVGQDFSVYANLARNLLHTTHLISSNRHTTRILLESFDVDHLFRGVAAETGYPRIDLTLNLTDEAKLGLMKRLGLTAGRKVLLYAPTWRGKLGQIETNAEEMMRDIQRMTQTGCQVLFRGHFLGGDIPESSSVPDDISSNELLAIVDILVTDYSSIAFDFMATGRPILYYLNDFKEYSRERGLYFDVDELPGKICTDLEILCSEVVNTLREGTNVDPERYKAARDRFCPMEDGCAAKRVVDLMFTPVAEAAANTSRHNVLIYPGGFQPNGVTTSLLNLLRRLDYSKLNVTLAILPWKSAENLERQQQFDQLPNGVRVLPRVGTMNLTVEERWVLDQFNANHDFSGSAQLWEIYSRAHEREYKRLFGSTSFDALVEFSGYSSFWASVFAFAPEGTTKYRAIYQHNDKYHEWNTRFPQLERIFRIYHRFDRLISVCDATRKLNVDSLAEHFNLPVEQFDHCDNMLNPEGVIERSGEPLDTVEEEDLFSKTRRTFISIARLSVEKDHEKLIRAFERLYQSRMDIRLLIVGDGPLLPQLKRLVQQIGMEEHIRLLGFRLNPFPYLKRADCLVMSSNYEGQGLVLFEAMILDKAVISTDIAACRSVIEGRSGMLVENSIDGLAEGMRAFCDGELEAVPVDLSAYQGNALESFYKKVCNLTP
ncbi:MAG: CDP-glycerol glycerophosphotransferase family protein [Verrucomicrobiota bacterium]